MRRLFVGDLHGCRTELDELLEMFGFRAGEDALYSVGDVVGKGPDVVGTLQRLKELGARAVRGNHEEGLLRSMESAQAREHPEYRAMLGPRLEQWADEIASWPYFLEMHDIILVHAGLEPGKEKPADMSPRVLTGIRTWDGKGKDLNRPGDPPWFEVVSPDRTVVFGHWAQRGVIDLPRFKGLDSGCVYGKYLTGWCPEENRFYSAPAHAEYSPIHYKGR